MALKFDPEIERPLKSVIAALDELKAVGPGPYHTQGELVQATGMPELEKNTNILVEAADVFFGKTMVEYTDALQKMVENQKQMKESLGIAD